MWEAFRKAQCNSFIFPVLIIFYLAHYDAVKKAMQSASKSPGCDSQLSLLNCVTLEINLTSLGLSYLHNIKVVLAPAKFTDSL